MKVITSRRKSREKAVQVLYSWQISHNDLLDIQSYFIMEYDMAGVNISYFNALCIGVTGNVHILDNLMKPYLLRNFNEMGCIELTVLRIALFEFVQYPDMPHRVIINEAIELSKIFGAENSYKFINGVLDKVIT